MDIQTEVMVHFLILYCMYTFIFYCNSHLPGDQFPLRQMNTEEQVNTTYVEWFIIFSPKTWVGSFLASDWPFESVSD